MESENKEVVQIKTNDATEKNVEQTKDELDTLMSNVDVAQGSTYPQLEKTLLNDNAKATIFKEAEVHLKTTDEPKIESSLDNQTTPTEMDMDIAEVVKADVNVQFTEKPTKHQTVDATTDAKIVHSFCTTTLSNTLVEDVLATNINSENVIHSNMLVTPAAPTEAKKCVALSGLGLLAAQYDSNNESDNCADKSSDTDSVVEVPPTLGKNYRNHVVEINSDSDSNTSSDSDVEYLTKIRKAIDKRIADDKESEDDDEEESQSVKNRKRIPPKVKGEMLLEDLPPIEDLHITVPEEECKELGRVQSIVDQLVLINTLPNSVLLDLETVLFLEKGKKVLGAVFDVLGQVADPLYCVRFNSNKQIIEREIKVGDVVYVAPKTEYTQFVILSNLMKMRGSDASWENDVEPPPRYLDYSDDEDEREARRRQLRGKERPNDHPDPTKRVRTDGELPTSTMHLPTGRDGFLLGANHHSGRSHGWPTPVPVNNGSNNYGHRNSWHSNYYYPPQRGAPLLPTPPAPYHRIPQNYSPASQYNRYAHMTPSEPPMYVLNPYARPRVPPASTVAQQTAYAISTPPPPPPGDN